MDEQGLTLAKEAALGAINDPVSLFVHQRNMLSLPAVQALSKNAGKFFSWNFVGSSLSQTRLVSLSSSTSYFLDDPSHCRFARIVIRIPGRKIG